MSYTLSHPLIDLHTYAINTYAVGLSTFIVAGELTMMLLLMSLLISTLSVGMSLLQYARKGSFGFRSQLLCLIATVFFNFVGFLSYMMLTVDQLGLGGFYLLGMACSAANVAVGLVSMIISFLADAVIKMERQQGVLFYQYGSVTELTRQQDAATSISDEI